MGFNTGKPAQTLQRISPLQGLVDRKLYPMPARPTLKTPAQGFYSQNHNMGRGNRALFASNQTFNGH